MHKAEQLLSAPMSGSKLHRLLMREHSTTTTKAKPRQHHSAGLTTQASFWESISIMLCAAMVASGGLLEPWLMAMSLAQGLCSNTTAAIGTAALWVFQMNGTESSPLAKLEKTNILQQQSKRALQQAGSTSSRRGSMRLKKRRTPCPSRKPRPTCMRFCTISNYTKTKPGGSCLHPFSCKKKTHTC